MGLRFESLLEELSHGSVLLQDKIMSDFDWNGIIKAGDAERIWSALYWVVRDHRAIETCSSSRSKHQSLDEIYSDITQEVFLRLIAGDRLTYFFVNGLSSKQIESDLLLNEVALVVTNRRGLLAAEAPDTEQQPSELCHQPATLKTSYASKPV